MIEITVPSPGESITQVQIAQWLVEDGQEVEKDQEIVEIDSDKATFPVSAPVDGKISIKIPEGETVDVGALIATMEEIKGGIRKKTTTTPKESPPVSSATEEPKKEVSTEQSTPTDLDATPLAKKIIHEEKISADAVRSAFPGKRVTRKDIESWVKQKREKQAAFAFTGERTEERQKLSTLRLKLSERLVAVKNETAMLTTFNEVNMKPVLEIKSKYNEAFKEKYGVGIGLTSFFAKAASIALQEFPQVNARIDGKELVLPNYVDLGIAVSAPKGLMVPVIRNTESLSIPEIEVKVKEMAGKARNNRIAIDDMQGGTFTITNGGVFGSLMSTPILNPPQSGILGLHKIMDRPMAVNGKVEILPMMYLALSYDHRVIDGRESVGFLVKIKELIESPEQMLTGGQELIPLLLDLD
jgi:2-oxoglutarate dehydrogenase E2 component (dihydrolipoamide succinyltransferase)